MMSEAKNEMTNPVQRLVMLRFLDLLDEEYDLTSDFYGNGCEHGFKPAKDCTNKDCKYAELHKLFEKLKVA